MSPPEDQPDAWITSAIIRPLVLMLVVLAAGFWLTTETLVRPWVVSGPSMQPALQPGDRVLVDLWTFGRRRPRGGEVVLVELGGAMLVKRIAERPAELTRSGLWVLGDNARVSHDSREFGAVEPSRILGRVVWRYWPPSRAGWIR